MGEVVFKANLAKGAECPDDRHEIVCMHCALVSGIEPAKLLFGETGKGAEDGYEHHLHIDTEHIGSVTRRADFLGDGDTYCCSTAAGNTTSSNLRQLGQRSFQSVKASYSCKARAGFSRGLDS